VYSYNDEHLAAAVPDRVRISLSRTRSDVTKWYFYSKEYSAIYTLCLKNESKFNF